MGETKHDVVIVGAGIAGLTCANYLISSGKKVMILEHNHQAGGLMGGFKRKGFYFDAGDQSFEESGVVFSILKDFGLYDEKEWEFSDYKMVWPQGIVNFRDRHEAFRQFADLFPNQRSNVLDYFEGLDKHIEIMEDLQKYPFPFFTKGITRIKSMLNMIKVVRQNKDTFEEIVFTSAADHVEKNFPGLGLQKKIAQLGYRNMPLFMGIGLWHSLVNDYWYPRIGLQGLMNKMVDRFKSLGGEIKFNHTVDEILVENGKAVGVRTKDNDIFNGSSIVFAGSTKRLYTEYLSSNLLDDELIKKMKEGVVSEQLAAVYLGVDMTTDELKKYLETHHTFYLTNDMFKDYDNFNDEKLHQDSFVEISWPSFRNPELAPEGKNSLVLNTSTAYKWMNNWGTGGDDFKRTPEYSRLKEKVIKEVVKNAEKVIPNLSDRIVYQDFGSPLSTIRFTLNPEGSTGGWTYDHEKTPLKGKYLDLFTPIDRLLTIGHYAIWPGGVPFAALSGWMGAKAVNKERFFKPIMNYVSRKGKN